MLLPCCARILIRCVSNLRRNSSSAAPTQPASPPFKVHYILPNGARKTCEAAPGDNLMDLAIANNIDIEGLRAIACTRAWPHVRIHTCA